MAVSVKTRAAYQMESDLRKMHVWHHGVHSHFFKDVNSVVGYLNGKINATQLVMAQITNYELKLWKYVTDLNSSS